MRNGMRFVGVGGRLIAGAAQSKALATNECWLARTGWLRRSRSAS